MLVVGGCKTSPAREMARCRLRQDSAGKTSSAGYGHSEVVSGWRWSLAGGGHRQWWTSFIFWNRAVLHRTGWFTLTTGKPILVKTGGNRLGSQEPDLFPKTGPTGHVVPSIPGSTGRYGPVFKTMVQLVKFAPIYDLIVSGLSRGITQLDYISVRGLESLCIRLA